MLKFKTCYVQQQSYEQSLHRRKGLGSLCSAGLSCRMREVLVSTETFVTKKCPLAFLGILHNFAVLPAQFWWFQWASWSSLLCAISAYLVLIKGPLLMSGFRYLVLLILRLPQQWSCPVPTKKHSFLFEFSEPTNSFVSVSWKISFLKFSQSQHDYGSSLSLNEESWTFSSFVTLIFLWVFIWLFCSSCKMGTAWQLLPCQAFRNLWMFVVGWLHSANCWSKLFMIKSVCAQVDYFSYVLFLK